MTRRYATTTHSTVARSIPNACPMLGRAMLTMLPSRVAMKVPTETAESTSHWRRRSTREP